MSTNVLIFGILILFSSLLNYFFYGEVVDEENERVKKLFGNEKAASRIFNILSGRFYSKETVKFLSKIGIVIGISLIISYLMYYIYQCIKSYLM